ncbi:hypothetical protein ACNO8X_03425 [Mycobacterium sp. PDNC021]
MVALNALTPAARHRAIAADLAAADGRKSGLDPEFAAQMLAGMAAPPA